MVSDRTSCSELLEVVYIIIAVRYLLRFCRILVSPIWGNGDIYRDGPRGIRWGVNDFLRIALIIIIIIILLFI